MEELMRQAGEHGIQLEPEDFAMIDGVLSLDGMPADQWVDAMTMD